jgi:hypothetical protein
MTAKKKLTKAWCAVGFGSPTKYKVVLQPVGEWCVVRLKTGTLSVTHLPTGLAGYQSSVLTVEQARRVLAAFGAEPGFTLATWTPARARRFQKLLTEAMAG